MLLILSDDGLLDTYDSEFPESILKNSIIPAIYLDGMVFYELF